MKGSFTRKILAGFLISGGILFIAGTLALYASNRFISANRWANRTHEVLHELEGFMLSSVDATVGERAYILTGDENFLRPYHEAKLNAKTHLGTIRSLTIDNPTQQRRLDSLQKLFLALTSFYESCIDLRTAGREPESVALLRTGQGIRIENDIRVIVRAAEQEVTVRLTDHIKQSEAEASAFRSVTLFFIITLITIITIGYLAIVARTRLFRKSEEAANKTITDYKFALDEANIVAVTDQKGIIKHVNDNFCRISKYSSGELIGQDHRIINSGYHSKEFIRNLWTTIARGKIWKGELKNKAKDGSIYWVDTTIVPFLNEQGKPYQYLAIRSDITKRKKAEEEIIESKRQLQEEAEALKELNDAGNRLWRTDNQMDGMQEMLSFSTRIFRTGMGCVQLYDNNKKALTIAASKGLSDEILHYYREVSAGDNSPCGRALRDRSQVLIEDVDKDENLTTDAHIFHAAGVKAVQSTPLFNRDGTSMGMISTLQADSGAFDPFRLRIMELYARKAESFVYRLGINEDLKKMNQSLESRVSERTLQLTQSLQREKELNDIKSRFVAMASHEFRTPLSAILSSVSLIDAYHDEDQKDKRDKHISRIKSSVKNLEDILNDFLSLDRLELGKIELLKEKFDLHDLSRDVVEEVNGMLKKGQRINLEHNGLNEIVQDRKILKNVFLNLLSNAIKYSQENKEIRFQTEVSNNAVSIRVKDSGIGIPEEEQKNLFSKFYRARNVSNIQGTGLGLTIVKKYVELLDGTITFESKLDQGTTFTVLLPQKAG